MEVNRYRTGFLIGAASVALGVATTAGLAVAADSTSGGRPQAMGDPLPAQPTPSNCDPPALPGSVVDVTFTDMGPGMMGPGMMGPGMGMMQIAIDPRSVPAGTVSLRAVNRGAMLHEVVALPLARNQPAGQRPVGADWQADETGSLGEAARTCGSGEGAGVAPGAWSWTTLNLPPGRYELICNIAGHYSAGMYTELDVT